MKQKTVLSLEQALTLPYATQRFAQLGWRVIRIESAKQPGRQNSGDPNRYIGEDTGADDQHAYFIAPNIGKEAITLNLKKEEGRKLFYTLIKKLDVDVFLCNTLPKRHESLGIDYETLKQTKDDLIWCSISALGTEYPNRAGYDPALQALLGYMYLTGEPERDPMLCGLPIIDLKAGDEAFAQVMLALLEHAANGKGKRIDISMAQCATSWLITALPQLEFVKDQADLFTRSANEHRSFIPSNCYPTADGYVYLAIGSDLQFEKLSQIEGLSALNNPKWKTNNDRKIGRYDIYEEIKEALKSYTTERFIDKCLNLDLAVSAVNTIKDVSELEYIKKLMIKTKVKSGKEVSLFPAAMNTDFLESNANTMSPAPGLGEHNESILTEAGFSSTEIQEFKDELLI